MSLSQCHYDKPQSHSQYQTRWVLSAGKKIFAPSIKILDLKLTPNQDSYFPALIGAYGALSRVQLKLAGRIVDIWNAKSVLPLLMTMSGDNEKQRGINKQLYGSGNNLIYDDSVKLLSFDRPRIYATNPMSVQLKLGAYLDLLNNIGVINDEVEIICEWEQNVKKVFCPVTGGTAATAYTIPNAPYLSYETFNGAFQQPNHVPYRMWVEDRFAIPAIGTDNTMQRYEVRSNAFNNHTIGRLLLVNTPSSVDAAAPEADVSGLFNIFSLYMSVPMKQENYNLAKDGSLIFSLRNVNNDATKLSATADAWGDLTLATGGHIHTNASIIKELQTAVLNGFASYGSVELNEHISKELQLSYMRTSDVNNTYPSLGGALTISAIAEVKCMLVDGQKVYV